MADDQRNSLIYKAVNLLTRSALVAYAVMASWAFLETRQLLKNKEHTVEGKTLYWPLLLCLPDDITFSQGTVTVTADGDEKCRQLDFMINAAASSLLLSAIGSLLFSVIDFCARRKMGPFNSSSAAGMMTFLSFILIQAGIVTGALLEQNRFWTEYYESVLEQIKASNSYFANVNKVKPYANTGVLATTALLAFAATGFIILDTILFKCCVKPNQRHASDRECEVAEQNMAKQASDLELSTRQMDPIETSNNNKASDAPDGSPSWTTGL